MEYQTEADALAEWQTDAEVEDHFRESHPPKIDWACPVCEGYTKRLYGRDRLCIHDGGCGWQGKMYKDRKGRIREVGK